MSIPDYQTVMLPLLKLVSTHHNIKLKEARTLIAQEFNLSEAEQNALLPSGKQPIIYNRVGWAAFYLRKAGLLSLPQRGTLVLTERGAEALKSNPERIDVTFLRQFPEFVAFQTAATDGSRNTQSATTELEPNAETPEELLEESYSLLKNQVLEDTVDKIKTCSPRFFEELVVDTIVKMGYGGSRKDAGKAVGQSGDEGIDGIINEDRLGLDVIYLQAKRWEANIGRPEIQKFAGALQGKRARKGIFITTSEFTSEAKEFVKNIEAKIILISGKQLAELMWEHNVGLSTAATFEIKKIDSDYFQE